MLKNIFVCCAVLFLAGCKPCQDYQCLMTHPDVLQKQVSLCVNNPRSTCEVVEKADRDFAAMVAEERQNPTGYGMKIMQQQGLVVQLEGSRTDKSALHAEKEKLAIMMAVAAVTCWES